MSFNDATESEILSYVFRNVVPGWAANANFWLAAHTANPSEAGTAITSEAAYGSYARVAMARPAAFTVTGSILTNAALVQFPASTVLGADITHLSLVTTASGAGQIINRFALLSSLPTAVGIQVQFAIGTISFVLD